MLCHKYAVGALKNGDPNISHPRCEEGVRFVEEGLRAVEEGKFFLEIAKDVVPDVVIDSEFDLNPYGISGKVVSTPGHSDDSICIILNSGEAIIGDLVQDSPYTGNLILGLQAIDEIKMIESLSMLTRIAHTLYAGHGGYILLLMF